MAPQNNRDRLAAAWRALSGEGRHEGWRTIPIDLSAPCRLLAGKHFPGDAEAILVGFQSVGVPLAHQLPQGRGFDVAKVESAVLGTTHVWLSVSRRGAGSLGLFTTMTENLTTLLEECADVSQERLFALFLSRIRAWQQFMERGQDEVLGPEAEVGVFGELVVLNSMLEAGLPGYGVIESWQGPLNYLHDFVLGLGVIEVKTTVAPIGFLANIGSLEQLDDKLVHPLFVAAVRLSLDTSGMTLPAFAKALGSHLEPDKVARRMFETRLLNAGFLIEHAERYSRRFSHVSTRMLLVDDRFPKLTRSNVRSEVTMARYQLDLDLVNLTDISVENALAQLGVH